MRAEETSLGAVVARTGGALQTGPFGSQLHASDYTVFGTPLVMPVNLGDNEIREEGIARVSAVDAQRLRRHALRVGDIVFSRRGDVGRRSIIRTREAGWLCGTGCLAARFGTKLDEVSPEYIAFYLGSEFAQSWLADNAVGGTMPNLNTRILAALPLLLPTRQSQDAIVTALSDAHNVVEEIESQIAKKQAIKQGLIQQLLTGRTRLSSFGSTWSDVTLGDHVTYVKTVALSREQLNRSAPLRYLHYGDIHTRSSVTLDAATEEMPRADARLAGRAGLLRPGDLVFADASEDPAGVGKSVEIIGVPKDGVVPGLHTIAARFDKAVLADGFKAYLQFIPTFRQALLRLAAGTKVLATTRSYISSVTLPLPSVAEQQAIALVLQDCEAEIVALHDRLAKARAIKTGMMQQLLTGRVRLPTEAGA